VQAPWFFASHEWSAPTFFVKLFEEATGGEKIAPEQIAPPTSAAQTTRKIASHRNNTPKW